MSALASVSVLDLTRFLAGPFCTSLLADLGADVVKVEAPKGGDEGRYGYPTADGVPVFFLALNRNKSGITLRCGPDEGRALLRRLLPHFDVLVENFAGGTLARWGLDPHALVAEHPRLIVASLSGFGQTGPWSTRAVVRHHHAGGERLHVAHRLPRQPADARWRIARRLRAGPVRGHRRAGRVVRPGRRAGAGRWSTSRARTPCSRCSTTGRRSSPRRGRSRPGSAIVTWRRRRTTATGRVTGSS